MSALYIASLVLLKEPARLTRVGLVFLLTLAGLFVLQLLPVAPLLFPVTASLRTTHGVGQLWPATADAFYTVRVIAQIATYVMAALLVLRLRQAGLGTSQIMTGLIAVILVEGFWGMVRVFAQIDHVLFYEGTVPHDSASGTLVSRNNFGGLMAIGLLLAAVRAYGRFAWPVRDPHRPRWMRRIEGGWGWALAAAFCAVALVMSKSRGSAVAAVGGLVLLPFFYRGRGNIAGAAALLALGAGAVFVANPAGLIERFGAIDPFELSSESRWQIFTTTASAAMHQPVFGFGWGTHPRAYHPYQPPALAGQIHHAHNEYVNVLFEAGIVGLALLVVAMAAWFARVWSAQKPLPGPDRMPVTATLGAAAVVALHSFVDFDLRITGIGMVWAALIGMGAAAIRDGVARATWPVPIAALAAAALALVPMRGLGWSPYDYEAAWELARSTQDAAKMEVAADLWPAHPDVQREAGLVFWEHGDGAKAAKCLHRIFLQEPYAIVGVMNEVWSKDRPLADFEALLPPTPAARAVYAGWLAKRGLWKPAQEAFDRGVATEAANATWFDYYAAELSTVGQWGLEATVRDRRLAVKSDAWAHGAAARAWLKLGAHDRALDRAVTATRIDPSNPAWPGLRGEILESKGDRVGAVEAYTAACGLAPSDLDWRLRRAMVELADRTYAAAADDFREVLRSRPADRPSALGLARSLAGLGQTSSARIALDDWLRKHPDDGEAASLRDSLPR